MALMDPVYGDVYTSVLEHTRIGLKTKHFVAALDQVGNANRYHSCLHLTSQLQHDTGALLLSTVFKM